MFANFREQIARAEQCIDIAIALSRHACNDAHDLQVALTVMRHEVEKINDSAIKAGCGGELAYAVQVLEASNNGILDFQRHALVESDHKRKEAAHAVEEARQASAQLIDSLRLVSAR